MKKAYFTPRIDREQGRYRWCVAIWNDEQGEDVEFVFVRGPAAARKLAAERNLNIQMNGW